MARLGLDINLALQRLLGANKERAAANRSELEDRKLRKENAAEKAQLAADAPRPGSPTGAEEPRGGTPQLYRAPEPAAQRRRKLRVIGVDFNDLHEDPDSVLQSDIDWLARRYSYTDPPDPITTPDGTEDWNSNYYIRDLLLFASVAKDPTKNGQLSYTSLETFSNAIRYFEWTFRHASRRGFYNDEPRLVSTPPALDLPFPLSESRVVRAVGKALASCQGKDVYITRLIRVARPQPVWLDTAEYTYSRYTNSPNVYATSEDQGFVPLVTGRMAGEEGLRFDNRNYGPYAYIASGVSETVLVSDFSMHDANMLEWASNRVYETAGSLVQLDTEYVVYDYIALTWTYSGTTNTGNFTANTIRSYSQTYYYSGQTVTGEEGYDDKLTETTGSGDVQYNLRDMNRAAAGAFLDALPPDNPNSEAWAGYIGNPLAFIRDGYFDGPTFDDDRWPSHINYNPSTGVAHAALQIGDRYKVYTYRYTPAPSYRGVFALLPKVSDPESEYITRGWRQVLDTPAKGLGASLSGTGFTYTMPMI